MVTLAGPSRPGVQLTPRPAPDDRRRDTGPMDERIDELTRRPHGHRRAPPVAPEPARRPGARSAPAVSRRRSPTTCAGSSTVGRPCPTTAARWCCTPRTTTRSSGRSDAPAPAGWSTCGRERTAALGARDDVDYVLVFENRGPEVGATIAHPHGQIYAYPTVPAGAAPRAGRRGGRRPSTRHASWSCRDGRLDRMGPDAAIVALRAPPRAAATTWARSIDDDVRPRRARRAADRRARSSRPAVRRTDALHALDPSAPDRRRATGPSARLHLHITPLYRAPGRAALRRRRPSWVAGSTSTRSTRAAAAQRCATAPARPASR